MKRLLSFLLAAAMVFSLTACSYKEIDDALQAGGQTILNNTKLSQTPDPEIVDKQLGDTHLLKMDPPLEGSLKVSLLKKQAFDSIADTDIKETECTIPKIVSENQDLYLFLLLDIEINNIDAKLMAGFDEKLPFFISDFFPIMELNPDNPQLGTSYTGIVYFSEHPPITDTSTNYYHYNIEPGKKLKCQMGIFAPKIDYENNNLWLSIGAGTGLFFELFDDLKVAS